jgi:hypothetical protein
MGFDPFFQIGPLAWSAPPTQKTRADIARVSGLVLQSRITDQPSGVIASG